MSIFLEQYSKENQGFPTNFGLLSDLLPLNKTKESLWLGMVLPLSVSSDFLVQNSFSAKKKIYAVLSPPSPTHSTCLLQSCCRKSGASPGKLLQHVLLFVPPHYILCSHSPPVAARDPLPPPPTTRSWPAITAQPGNAPSLLHVFAQCAGTILLPPLVCAPTLSFSTHILATFSVMHLFNVHSSNDFEANFGGCAVCPSNTFQQTHDFQPVCRPKFEIVSFGWGTFLMMMFLNNSWRLCDPPRRWLLLCH